MGYAPFLHSAAYFFRLWLYLALPLPPPSYLTTHVNRHTPQVALSLYFTLPPKFRACALMFLGAIIGASTCGRSTVVDLYAVCSVAPCTSTLRSRLVAPAEASGLAAASYATILKLSEAKGSLPVSLTRDASPENLAQESK